jgi:hypothetical protein
VRATGLAEGTVSALTPQRTMRLGRELGGQPYGGASAGIRSLAPADERPSGDLPAARRAGALRPAGNWLLGEAMTSLPWSLRPEWVRAFERAPAP